MKIINLYRKITIIALKRRFMDALVFFCGTAIEDWKKNFSLYPHAYVVKFIEVLLFLITVN